MSHVALNIPNLPAAVALIPRAIEILGNPPELHDEVAGKVLWLGLAPLLPPKVGQGRLVTAHDDPGVRAADECAAIRYSGLFVVLQRRCNNSQDNFLP